MSRNRIAVIAATLAAAMPAACAHLAAPTGAAREIAPFELVNATFDSVTGFAVAPAGSAAFHDVEIGPPLQGGLNRLSLELPAGDCLRDLRVSFRNGRVLDVPGIDVCRRHGLRLTAN